MQQIDRMQTLIELKTVAPATVVPHPDATACDTPMPQHAKIDQPTENKENLNKDMAENVADIQQNATAHTTTTLQRYNATTLQRSMLQNVAVPQAKKRSLFNRVLHAVLRDD